MSWHTVGRAAVLGGLLSLGGCGYATARFSVERSAGLRIERPTLSLLGVYDRGRFDPEMAALAGARLAAQLGTCAPLFEDALQDADPALYERLDRTSKQEGLGSELLVEVAPRARGGFVWSMQLSGRRPTDEAPRSLNWGGRNGTGVQNGRHSPSNRGGGANFGTPTPRTPPPDDAAFTIETLVVPVGGKEPALTLSLRYSGTTLEDAFDQLAKRLVAELPGASCAGWSGTRPEGVPAP